MWLRSAAIADSRGLQVSAHCALNLHAHVAAAVPNLRHVEYFHDHHRVETMLFDGALGPRGGVLTTTDQPGHGLALRTPKLRSTGCAEVRRAGDSRLVSRRIDAAFARGFSSGLIT